MRVFRQLLGDDFAAGLQNIVERNFQLLGVGLEQIVDLLLRGSQVELDVLQASLGFTRKLFGSLLHVLVRHEGAHHAESAVNRPRVYVLLKRRGGTKIEFHYRILHEAAVKHI